MIGAEFWRGYFRVYDALNLLPTYRRLLGDMCAEVGTEQGELVLDAGSGTGNLALRISEAGGVVVALDYCRQALEIHRSKDSHSSLILADLRRQLPFRDSCFDKIASNNTLYTLSAEEQRNSLKELHRVLKPSGRIVLANPGTALSPLGVCLRVIADGVRAEGLWTFVRKLAASMPAMIKMGYYSWRLRSESRHQRFDPSEHRALLESAGFRLVSPPRLVYTGHAVLNTAHK